MSPYFTNTGGKIFITVAPAMYRYKIEEPINRVPKETV